MAMSLISRVQWRDVVMGIEEDDRRRERTGLIIRSFLFIIYLLYRRG